MFAFWPLNVFSAQSRIQARFEIEMGRCEVFRYPTTPERCLPQPQGVGARAERENSLLVHGPQSKRPRRKGDAFPCHASSTYHC
jgi:hypothetical protein